MVIIINLYYYSFINVSCTKSVYNAPIQHIKLISEGLCDTEDWSNGSWKVNIVIT